MYVQQGHMVIKNATVMTESCARGHTLFFSFLFPITRNAEYVHGGYNLGIFCTQQ